MSSSAASPAPAPSAVRLPSVPSIRTFRIGLVGFGVVGRGLVRLLERKGEETARRCGVRVVVERALVRDAAAPRAETPAVELVDDARRFAAGAFDAVCEATGACDAVLPTVRELLRRGVPVATANKALVAAHGAELRAVAARSGAAFLHEASVAAGVPLFHLLDGALRTTEFSRVSGVLNGTCNYVFDRASRTGIPLERALRDAREAGLAEPDPFDDLSGADAARKLAILVRRLWGAEVPVFAIETRGVADVSASDFAAAARQGFALRPAAAAGIRDGRVFAWVGPAAVRRDDPLASLNGAQNGVRLEGDVVPEVFISGPGAGPEPTAAALLDDVLRIAEGAVARRGAPEGEGGAHGPALAPARTPWLVSVEGCEGGAARAVAERLANAGLLRTDGAGSVESRVEGLTEPATEVEVRAAEAAVREVGPASAFRAFRALGRGVAS